MSDELSAEAHPTCVECGADADEDAVGWKAYFDDRRRRWRLLP
jgi:hypothetical protein